MTSINARRLNNSTGINHSPTQVQVAPSELQGILTQMTNILEKITDGIVIYDLEWRFTFVNQRGAQIAGKTPEELLGKKAWDVYPEAVGSRFYQEFHRAIAQQVSVHFQEFYAPLNIWLEIHAYPSPEELIVLYGDITQRKQAEESLQAAYGELEYRLLERTLKLSQVGTLLEMQRAACHKAEEALRTTNEQLANILNSITDGFCAVDREWRFTYVNQRAEQILQKNQTELLGKIVWDVYPWLIGSTVYNKCHEALDTGVPVRCEVYAPSWKRWFETNLYPSLEGLSLYFQDITNRKRIEEERNQLLVCEQQARAKAELVEQRCTFLSQASEVLMSSLHYETTLKSVARLTVPFLADYCLIHRLEVNGQLRMVAAVHDNPHKQPLLDEFAHRYQVEMQNPNNLIAQVLRTGEALLVSEAPSTLAKSVNHNSRLLELYDQLNPKSLIIIPLTARKQMLGILVLAMAESNRCYDRSDLSLALELSRRAATAMDNAQLYHKAQESNRLKDEFLLTLSHELRTPLNAIVGWANMLVSRNMSERLFRQAIETIEQKARAQVRTICDLLDLSCLLTGTLRLNPTWVELGAIVKDAIATLKLAFEAKSIQLNCRIDPSLGVLRGDSKYLRQVVWHLLSNAIKFTPNGGQVEIYLTKVDNYAQIQVSDTGEGIHPDFLPYVFDCFRQADASTTRRHTGMGLGLALVRQMIELHGGTVEASSDGEGKGATFTVKLPLASVFEGSSLHPDGVTEEERRASRHPLRLEGLQLLVVDDETHSREAIASILAEYGADAIAVATIHEALQVLECFQPDLVIRSNNMLELDASWLLSRMRHLSVEKGGQIPIVALSTDVGQEDVTGVRSAGIEMHVAKPIAADELAGIVATLTGRDRQLDRPNY
jgi:PAS domain S-box-containing protein